MSCSGFHEVPSSGKLCLKDNIPSTASPWQTAKWRISTAITHHQCHHFHPKSHHEKKKQQPPRSQPQPPSAVVAAADKSDVRRWCFCPCLEGLAPHSLDWCKENLAGNLYIWMLNKKKTWGPVKMFPEKPIQWCMCGSPIFLHCVAKNSERWYNPDSVSYPGRQCDSKWLQITFALH